MFGRLRSAPYVERADLGERDRQSDRQLDVTRLPPEAEYGDKRRMFPRVHVRIERDDIARAIRSRRRAEERERHGTIRHDGEQMIEGPFRTFLSSQPAHADRRGKLRSAQSAYSELV